ncbi:Integrator complex subunit 7, partial [Orchesella cincta]
CIDTKMRSNAENGFGLGEPEMDANTALTDLDKGMVVWNCHYFQHPFGSLYNLFGNIGLRSNKIGDQCEAIVRFPALFERYPFPILINSAFLKLADVFRTGSNFLRLWVLRVCLQSESHLQKILNVDEFVRRIFSVIHANDPIARALTLRTLGSLSALIPERKPVHHSIRVALDSHDRVEVSAAIYAAACFAKRSKTFGTTMCTKISSMVKRLSTPLDLKLRLICIFQYMHHDVGTASMVRKNCQELLVNYPSEEFMTTILHTLTQLAAATITDLTEQVNKFLMKARLQQYNENYLCLSLSVSFLLSHLDDSRAKVKLSILNDLKCLGEKGGHLWEASHISALISSIIPAENRMETDEEPVNLHNEIVYTALDVISSITSSSAILQFIYTADSPLWKLLESSIESSDMLVALKAIEISTFIALHSFIWMNRKSAGAPTSSLNLVEMAKSGIESLANTICALETAEDKEKEELLKDLEKCLSYGVVLCKAEPSLCGWFCSAMIKQINRNTLSVKSRNLVCQAIGSIGSFSQDAIQKVMPDILSVLLRFEKSALKEENSTVAVLIAIIFQAHQGFSLSNKVSQVINNIMSSSCMWFAYRLSRNALRYGQPNIATIALNAMPETVSSENFHFWLSSLQLIAQAEKLLSKDESKTIHLRLMSAGSSYVQAVNTLKAASCPLWSLQFQIEFVRLRSEMLAAFTNFLTSCNAVKLSPPPAIAQSIALAARDDLLKYGRVVTQMRKSVRDFQLISDMYGRLYQTAFDADNTSLLNIQILQQMCLMVSRAIEKVVVSKDHPSFSGDESPFTFCTRMNYIEAGNSWSLILACKKAAEIMRTTTSSQRIIPEQIMILREAFGVLIETPLAYPRFFFQTLQNTRTKIAVSPQPRGDSVPVLLGSNLALKIEGVLQQSGNQGAKISNMRTSFRRPKAIRITVTSAPPPNPRGHMMDVKAHQEQLQLVKDIVPHRNFFQAQFLLSLTLPGVTNVTVDTSLVDYEGRIWMTGPRASLAVRVYEDIKQNVPTTAAAVPRQGTPTGISSHMPVPGTSAPTGMIQRF